MSELFGIEIQQPTNLADIYYMSCEVSQNNSQKINFLKPIATSTLILAVMFTCNIESYAANYKQLDSTYKEKIENVWSPFDKFTTIPLSSIGNLRMQLNTAPQYAQLSQDVNKAYEKAIRQQMLLRSFSFNCQDNELSYSMMQIMQITNKELSKLPFNNAILQYNKYEEAWQYNLFFNKDIELTVGVYTDEMYDDVDFSIYHGKKLLVANHMPIKQIVNKMRTIISKISRND